MSDGAAAWECWFYLRLHVTMSFHFRPHELPIYRLFLIESCRYVPLYDFYNFFEWVLIIMVGDGTPTPIICRLE
jgi:hypothetical protein